MSRIDALDLVIPRKRSDRGDPGMLHVIALSNRLQTTPRNDGKTRVAPYKILTLFYEKLRMTIALILFLLLPTLSHADISKEKLPIPRYVTIKFDEVNARTGPAVDCPIEWVFIRKGEPVEIIAEYEQWRKIRDMNEEGGWIHSSALSSKRSVILIAKNTMPLIGAPGNYDDIVVKLKPKIRCSLVKCKDEWCQIKCQTYKGWIARKFLWGVYPDE